MSLSVVHPVTILSAVFCVIWSFVMSVTDASDDIRHDYRLQQNQLQES